MEWKALGKAVTRRRVDRGYPTLVAFSEAVGLSTRLLGDLEGGRRQSYDPATLARIERALQWPPGAVEAILSGGPEPRFDATYLYGDPDQPSPLQPPPLHPLAADLNDLLGDTSPLSEEHRVNLRNAMQVLLIAARQGFQSNPMDDQRMLGPGQPQPKNANMLAAPSPFITVRNLGALLDPETPMADEDRQALHRLVAAAIQLGQTAMMRYDDLLNASDEPLKQGPPPIPQAPAHMRGSLHGHARSDG